VTRCPKCGAENCERCPKCHALPLWREARLESERLAIETCHGCGVTTFYRRILPDDRPIEINLPEPLPVPDFDWKRGQPLACHPDRKHYGNGLCNPCYQRWWAARRPHHYGLKPYGELTRARSR
jgi:hypothetical protein